MKALNRNSYIIFSLLAFILLAYLLLRSGPTPWKLLVLTLVGLVLSLGLRVRPKALQESASLPQGTPLLIEFYARF